MATGPIAKHSPAPLRGREEARSGREAGVIRRERFSVTRRDRGRGVPPPPRQPLPHGGDSPSIHCPGGDNLSAVNVNTLPKIRFMLPVHGYPDYRHALPAPLRGREEAAERPGGGGDPAREVFSDTSRQGRGEPSPPPPSPSAPPPRGDSPSIHCPGVHPHTRFPVINSPKILSLPSCTAIRTIAKHSPAPLRGREEARSGRDAGDL